MKTVGIGWTPTAENINALPDPVRKFIHDLEALADPAGIVRENVLARDTIRALEAWVNDLQTGLYINCVYCGHRYGPGEEEVPAAALAEHVATCPRHPLARANAEIRSLKAAMLALRRGSCYCEVGIGNPMVKDHSTGCKAATLAVAEPT